jgi:hypothetical protein
MLSLSMPLTPVQRPGIETPAGVTFGMMHGGTSVRVVVAREVLQDGSDDRASLLARFAHYRRQFEAIASNKFDLGEKGPIKVARADVVKFAADRRQEELPA